MRYMRNSEEAAKRNTVFFFCRVLLLRNGMQCIQRNAGEGQDASAQPLREPGIILWKLRC